MCSDNNKLKDKIESMHAMQNNTIDDAYDNGFFNGIEYCLSLFENRKPIYKPFKKDDERK